MKNGQFIVGMVDGTIDSFQSEGVETLIPSDSLRFLYDLGKHNKNGTFVFKWENERAISKTIIIQKSDGEGRLGTINHTVIAKFEGMSDILDHTDFLTHLNKAFNIEYELLSNPLRTPEL